MRKEVRYLVRAAEELIGKIEVMNGCCGSDFVDGDRDEWPEFVKLRVAIERAKAAVAKHGEHGPEEWFCVLTDGKPKPGAFYATREEAQAHVDSWKGGSGPLRVANIREVFP